ncbi:RNA-binding protein 4F [Drosophila guanche]|uniref:Blast:RNA-binding protein 4F n=2 Tax=Drosophila guanche TaxID=7266 RepID=A0A3B0KVA0_DROGU|nr:RNA-binding protein 4F [Drosophila guanche]SPP89281.1 blast:RNA-binding protein 4F [Drosophila guanche]
MDSDAAEEAQNAGDSPSNVAPIEISSDSDESDSDSMSSSGSESLVKEKQEQELKSEFDNLSKYSKLTHRQVMRMSEIAFILNDYDMIMQAAVQYKKIATMPPELWRKDLRVRLLVTQSREEHSAFEEACIEALNSYYDVDLANMICNYLCAQKNIENISLWSSLMSKYSLENPDFIEKLRELLVSAPDAHKNAEALKAAMETRCINWDLDDAKCAELAELLDQYKKKLSPLVNYDRENLESFSPVHIMQLEQINNMDYRDEIRDALGCTIFEITVSNFRRVERVWLDYINYTSKSVERPTGGYQISSPLEVAKRAAMSTTSRLVNHKLIHLMETEGYSVQEVDNVLEGILPRLEINSIETVELHLDYLAYRVRNCDLSDMDQCTEVRQKFDAAWNTLSDLYGEKADNSYEVLQLYAQVEYSKFLNPEQGYKVWEYIMSYEDSQRSGYLWMTWAQMESEFNGGARCREILNQALSRPVLKDGHFVLEQYRRYERCHGDYKSITTCQEIKLPTEPHWHQFSRDQPRGRKPMKTSQPPLRAQAATAAPRSKAAATGAPRAKAAPAAPRAKEAAARAAPPPGGLKYSTELEKTKVFVKNIMPTVTTETLTELFVSCGTLKGVRLVEKKLPTISRMYKTRKNIAYIEYEQAESAQKAVEQLNGHNLNGSVLSVAISDPPPKTSIVSTAKRRTAAMSLIPSVVRREMVASKRRKVLSLDNETDAATKTDDGQSAGTQPDSSIKPETPTPSEKPKSNEDFRKLLG